MRRLTICLIALLATCGASCDLRVEQLRNEINHHPTLACIRHHESDRGPWPHRGGYQAQNPSSTASGAYQILDGSWAVLAAQAGVDTALYPTAAHAPWYVQDWVAFWAIAQGGKHHWRGSGC